MTLTMCSMIVSYGQTFTSKMDSVNTKTDTAFTHNEIQFVKTLFVQNIKEQKLKIIADKQAFSDCDGKGALIISGLAIVASGAFSMIANNLKAPTPNAHNTSEIEDYNQSVKNMHNLSSGFLILSGMFLTIGVIIHIK